jgi:membrane protease YdiL (CAAX protease family)
MNEPEAPVAPSVPPQPSLRDRVRPYVEGLGGEPLVIVCGASAVLIASHYQGATGWYHNLFADKFDKLPYTAVIGHFWWFASSLFLYMLVPLVLAYATRGSFHEKYGLGLGDWKQGLAISGLFLAVMLPATWLASGWDAFKGQYPLAGNAAYQLVTAGKPTVSWKLFALYELAYFSYFIGWEFLFRGWMLQGLARHWGKPAAILMQVAPFAVMHLGKAEIEAMGSIVAGIALGILAIRTRSFWYGVAIHGVIAVWMDWLSAKSALLGS